VKQLNFPSYDFKIRKSANGFEILDDVRKKWVVLTPEEWVRQHTIRWLISEKNYPAGLIAIERQILINGVSNRFDAVVFDRNASPLIVVECKAPEVEINEAVFDQAARYNMNVNASMLLITNGISHYCCTINHQEQTYQFLKDLPKYRP
jgi:type I site-specific restriction-modification system R (restriction) subunit